jgi:hypothetical protein
MGLGNKEAEVKVTLNTADEDTEDPEEDVVYYGDDESFEGDAVSEAEDAAVRFVAEVLSGIGIHGNMDSYREDDTIYISVTIRSFLSGDAKGSIAFSEHSIFIKFGVCVRIQRGSIQRARCESHT